MTEPKFYREKDDWVVKDTYGNHRKYPNPIDAAKAYAVSKALWETRFRVFLVEDCGLVTIAFGVHPGRTAARHGYARIAASGPFETRWRARQRRKRLIPEAESVHAPEGNIGLGPWYDLTPHLVAALRRESVGLYGPDVRKIRAGRRRAEARTQG